MREFGIADMPEASGANSSNWGWETEKEKEIAGKRRGTADQVGMSGQGRVDPRTAIVFAQAVARDSALEKGELLMATLRRATTEQVPRH
jgi:hypothetical protein